jgi:hypothetical protein
VLGWSIALELRGRHQEARVMREETVREARAAGIEWLVALGTYWIAHGILLQGDPSSARAVYEEAREIWRSHGERQGMGLASILIGVCALNTGDQQRARSMVREGLQLTHEAGARYGELMGLDAAAAVAARMGNWGVAATLLGATQTLRESRTALVPAAIQTRESTIAAVEGALDPTTLSSLWDKGSAMTLNQATVYALEHL